MRCGQHCPACVIASNLPATTTPTDAMSVPGAGLPPRWRDVMPVEATEAPGQPEADADEPGNPGREAGDPPPSGRGGSQWSGFALVCRDRPRVTARSGR